MVLALGFARQFQKKKSCKTKCAAACSTRYRAGLMPLEFARSSSLPGIHHIDPFYNRTGRQRLDAQMPQHVEALGTMMHGMCRDVREHAAARENVRFAVA